MRNGSGLFGNGDVTNVEVVCGTPYYRVSGILSGLQGSDLALVLENQQANVTSPTTQSVSPTADGSFEFPLEVQAGTPYKITVYEPRNPRQACVLTNGEGSMPMDNLTTVTVTCTTPTFTLGGMVSGLRGSGLVLTNNGGDSLSISSNGRFTFPTAVFDDTTFNVEVATSPDNPRQKCFLTQGIGKVFRNDWASVLVNCTATQQLGSIGDDEANAARVDAAMNLYVAGRTTGSLDGDPNVGGWDAFVFRLLPNGDRSWTRHLRSSGDDNVEAMANTFDSIYVTGSTSGSLDGGNAGGNDVFVAKYDRNGALQWIRQLGSSASDIAHAVTLDNNENVYIAGETRGALGGAAAGESDLFLAKLDSNGNLLWSRQQGTAAADVAYGVDRDASGIVYVAGGTTGNLDGVTNASGGEVGFVVQYDANGSKLNTKLLCHVNCERLGTRTRSRINSIYAEITGGYVVAGWLNDDPDTDFSDQYPMIYQFNASGARTGGMWGGEGREMRQATYGWGDGARYSIASGPYYLGGNAVNVRRTFPGAPGGQYGVDDAIRSTTEIEGRAIVGDVLSNYYVVGYTSGDLDGNPNLGGRDIFIARYNIGGIRQ